MSILIAGIVIGISSQHISYLHSYTEKLTRYLGKIVEYPLSVNGLLEIGKDAPISSFYIERNGYSLAYDAQHRNPSWVYEHLTVNTLLGETDRSNFNFLEDETIPNHLRTFLIDYKDTGFDRGHMAPAANHRTSSDDMNDTFYLTNICPQCPQFNRGYWLKLEKYVRDLTKVYDHVDVITGPLYLPYTDIDGNRYVKYRVIGQNDVAVPTHFKVITLEANGRKDEMAFILPNRPIEAKIPLDEFRTTIQKVEKASGILLSGNN